MYIDREGRREGEREGEREGGRRRRGALMKSAVLSSPPFTETGLGLLQERALRNADDRSQSARLSSSTKETLFFFLSFFRSHFLSLTLSHTFFIYILAVPFSVSLCFSLSLSLSLSLLSLLPSLSFYLERHAVSLSLHLFQFVTFQYNGLLHPKWGILHLVLPSLGKPLA